jgi:hypothetical protein
LILTGSQAGHQLPVELYLIRVAIGWLVKVSGALIGWRFSHLHLYSRFILLVVYVAEVCILCLILRYKTQKIVSLHYAFCCYF